MREKKRLDAWLNGASLRALDGAILVPQITEDAPQVEALYADNPGRPGRRLVAMSRVARRVAVRVQFRELYDLARRASLLDAVNAWADDGFLETSYRPGKRMRVRCVNRPAMGDARDVHAEYTVGFESAGLPFWEDVLSSVAEAEGLSGTARLMLGGSQAAPLWVTATPAAALTALSVSAGGCAFALTGLEAAAGTPVTIGYDARGILFSRAGSTAILDKRTPASSDDLMVPPGAAEIVYSADAACAWRFEARGLWR